VTKRQIQAIPKGQSSNESGLLQVKEISIITFVSNPPYPLTGISELTIHI